MNYFRLLTILVFVLMFVLPVSATDNSYEKEFSLENVDQLLIDQQQLRLITIGISVYPITTEIHSYEGSKLIAKINHHSSFGFRKPVTVDIVKAEGSLRLITAFENNRTIGINIGSLDIEILVPRKWDGELVLEKLTTKTLIENLDISGISGKASVTKLGVENCSFNRTTIELGIDTDLDIYNTDVGTCRISGAMGKISAENIRGAIDAKTFDGDIQISFAALKGETTLESTLGKISLELPEDTAADIKLFSKLSSVKCGVSLSSSSVLDNNEIIGSIGSPYSGNSINLRSGDGDVVLTTAAGEQK